jgi:hypothetical protein
MNDIRNDTKAMNTRPSSLPIVAALGMGDEQKVVVADQRCRALHRDGIFLSSFLAFMQTVGRRRITTYSRSSATGARLFSSSSSFSEESPVPPSEIPASEPIPRLRSRVPRASNLGNIQIRRSYHFHIVLTNSIVHETTQPLPTKSSPPLHLAVLIVLA